MSIDLPAKGVLDAVDWIALDAIEKRANALRVADELDAAAFADLWKAGLAATKNHPELLQTLDMVRPSS